ncbi:EAL domain-containing protein [Accumulibacter sp.]|uniref:EAL domain-containing protein n=1 Tax=Accumulibacter sp. TaxID=2053492 RepID=UPI0026227282|nr:EAL domain-containing protein [Accumulibacter sp.]
MSGRIRAVLTVAAAFLAVLLAIWILDQWIVRPAFVGLEQAQALEDGRRVQVAIQGELRQLSNELGDWAEWDDAYAFTETRDPAFIASNLGDWRVLERTSRLNLCFIFSRDGEVLYGGGHASHLGGSVVPAAFAGRPPAVWPLFQQRLEQGQSDAGLLVTEHGLLLLAARPILTTRGNGPARGMLVFGRLLDDSLLRSLVAQTQVSFVLLGPADPRLSAIESDYLSSLPAGKPVLRPGPQGAVFVYEALVDLGGQSVALLRTPIRQEISATARRTSQTLMAALSLAALILLLGGAWLRTRSGRVALAEGNAAAWGTAALVALIGLSLTFGLFAEWRERSQRALMRDFEAAASEQAERVFGAIRHNLEDLDTVRRFFDGASVVSRRQFRDFVTPILEHRRWQALEWLPRVPQYQRAAWEAAAQHDGLPGFRFTERDAQGRLMPASERPEYFPVYYLEPYAGNAAALGFAPPPEHPARGATLAAARDHGRMAVSGRYVLVQDSAAKARFSILVFAPVYRGPSVPGDVAERRRQLRGFVLGVMRVGEMVDEALQALPSQPLAFRVFDLTAESAQGWLYDYPSPAEYPAVSDANLRLQRDFPVADRVWRVEVGPSPTFVARHHDQAYRWIPVGGGLLTLLAALYLFALISQRQRAELLVSERTSALRTSEERFRQIVEYAPFGFHFYRLTERGELLFAGSNPAADAILKLVHADCLGSPLEQVFPGLVATDIPSIYRQLAQAGGTRRWRSVDYRDERITGSFEMVAFQTAPGSLAVAFSDITAMKLAEQRIEHLAYYDPLTDLPNRALLAQRADFALALAARHRNGLALLFLDLDQFKEVNDSLGHAEGDALLVQAAGRLQRLTRIEDTVCRLGGDEFVLLLPDTGQEGALRVADKLLAAFRQPFTVVGHTLRTTVSIGIALYPNDGSSFAELQKNADTALYQAKQDGRNTRVFYDRQMNAATLDRLVLESELRRALASGQLRAYYQPKVRLDDGQTVGAEALVRWQHPERGLIFPGQFIPVAEASDLIVELGGWMLAEVCRQMGDWRGAGIAPRSVAVNLSARHFRQPGLADSIGTLLDACQLSPQALELELTESSLLEAGTQTADTLLALERLGIGLTVDDFGTGYSSLSYLKRLPLKALKIDRSFVRDLVNDADDRTIAGTIVALGHGLGLEVVAEGVETVEQQRILLGQGCDLAQGYLFGQAVPPNEFAAVWLATADQSPI